MCHVLHHYSDAELKAVMDVATGKASWRPSEVIGVYKEIQVHGEVNLSQHVDCLVVNQCHKENEEIETLLAKFHERHNVPIVWMAETAQDRANRERARAAAAAEKARRLAAEEERKRREEAAKWSCWSCETRNKGTATTCSSCHVAKHVYISCNPS